MDLIFFLITELPKAIVVDIDGTIADITARLKAAGKKARPGSTRYWDEALGGHNYHLDVPIPAALEFLSSYRGTVIYLSGRREGTEEETKRWLRQHGFPDGPVIHRQKGTADTVQWKFSQVKRMQEEYQIEAGYGDLETDRTVYQAVRIKAIILEPNTWKPRYKLSEKTNFRD